MERFGVERGQRKTVVSQIAEKLRCMERAKRERLGKKRWEQTRKIAETFRNETMQERKENEERREEEWEMEETGGKKGVDGKREGEMGKNE